PWWRATPRCASGCCAGSPGRCASSRRACSTSARAACRRASGPSSCASRAPPHKEMASRVGTSREEVTRELSRLARQGLLERSGRVLVLRDVRALETLVADVAPEEAEAPLDAPDESREFVAPGASRQRRAILVADVLDSSSLMERDEDR